MAATRSAGALLGYGGIATLGIVQSVALWTVEEDYKFQNITAIAAVFLSVPILLVLIQLCLVACSVKKETKYKLLGIAEGASMLKAGVAGALYTGLFLQTAILTIVLQLPEASLELVNIPGYDEAAFPIAVTIIPVALAGKAYAEYNF